MRKSASLIAIATILLFFPSVRYRVSFQEWETHFYGLPLPWNSDAPAFSLAKEVYLIPLLIDFAIALLVAIPIFQAICKLPKNASRAIIPATWLFGFASLLMLWAIISVDPHFSLWPEAEPFQIVEAKVHIGA